MQHIWLRLSIFSSNVVMCYVEPDTCIGSSFHTTSAQKDKITKTNPRVVVNWHRKFVEVVEFYSLHHGLNLVRELFGNKK